MKKAEESYFDMDTVGPELVDRRLVRERSTEWSASETGWPRAAVESERVEYWRRAGERVGERVVIAHGVMA